jgi:type IV secretion system protein VirD4
MDVLLFVVVVLLFIVSAAEAAKRKEIRKRRKEGLKLLRSPETYGNPESLSSARWATDKLLRKAGLFKGKGWRFGYSQQSGKVLRYGGPGHFLLVAPARSGKAISVLVPALLERCNASRIIIDPKGELCAITHKRAARFSKVVALDPFGLLKMLGVKGVRVAGLNPLASLDWKSVSFGGDVASLADAIVWQEEGSGADRHWTDSARQLVAAVIRVLVRYGKPEEKNLLAVRDAICGNIFEFARKWRNCGDSVARQALARYAAKGAEESRELNGVVSTAVVQTDFVAMEGISASLSGNGLRFADLKRTRMTVYVVLPLDKLASCGKWFRLCIAAALGELLKAGPGGLPVLCVIDEFFSIGPLKAFQTAMSQAAGASALQLWPVLQDMAQLQTMYPREGWRTFMSNSSVKIFFGGAMLDYETADLISRMAGEQEMITLSTSLRDDKSRDYGKRLYDVDLTHSAGVGWQRLVQPHEVCRMNSREMIVFCEGVGGPIWAKRKAYFEGGEFRGQYGPNPYYNGGGSWLKRIFG